MLLSGDPAVRWGDKSYNLISFANGMSGCCCEHAPSDAMVMVHVAHYGEERLLEMEGRWTGSEKVRDIPLPEELVFTVDEKILNDVSQAKAQHLKVASDLQIAASPSHLLAKSSLRRRHFTLIPLLSLLFSLPITDFMDALRNSYDEILLPWPNRGCAILYSGGCQVVAGLADPSASLLEHQQKC